MSLEDTNELPTAPAPGSPPRIIPAESIPLSVLDQDALRVISRLERQGFEAYLVGGCVRDLLVGRIPKDFDVATSAHPRQIKRLFRNGRIIGRRFRLVHIYYGQHIVETATFRCEPDTRESEPRESPATADDIEDDLDDLLITEDNEFGTAEEDARRRDFTVNALFLDPTRGLIIDYVGGLDDLEARLAAHDRRSDRADRRRSRAHPARDQVRDAPWISHRRKNVGGDVRARAAPVAFRAATGTGRNPALDALGNSARCDAHVARVRRARRDPARRRFVTSDVARTTPRGAGARRILLALARSARRRRALGLRAGHGGVHRALVLEDHRARSRSADAHASRAAARPLDGDGDEVLRPVAIATRLPRRDVARAPDHRAAAPLHAGFDEAFSPARLHAQRGISRSARSLSPANGGARARLGHLRGLARALQRLALAAPDDEIAAERGLAPPAAAPRRKRPPAERPRRYRSPG